MKNKLYHILGIAFILIITSCANRAYKGVHYDQKIQGNEVVAILPFEVIFQGNLPKKMSEEEMLKQDRNERLGFQTSLYKWVGSRWRNNSLRIQDPTVTNARLTEAGFDIYKIEQYSPDDLAKAVGADVVFSSRALKHRYRGDWASMGIDVIQRTVNQTTSNPLPHIPAKTNDIHITVSLVHHANGITVWGHSRTGAANWNYPVHQVTENIHRRIVRRLPRK